MSTGAAPGTGKQSSRHNEQDVMFAQMMMPQALEMAKSARTRASMPEVGSEETASGRFRAAKAMAASIAASQTSEIATLQGLLKKM
ncbi:hypothetical protein ACQP1W_25920 [Spirillospora sp. CA-255316]